MSRSIVVAAAQMGPVSRGASRSEVLLRMKELLRGAAAQGAKLVVYPELALTSFFPRWDLGNSPAADAFYEAAVPGASTQGLFEEARRLEIGVCLGYAERETIGMKVRRFNSAVLTAADGSVVGRYRKIHLPGDREPQPGFNFQHLEKRCFEPGDLGFSAWRAFGGTCGMLLCNDRRWPEAWRVLGLQGVELVLVGYNTPLHNPEAPQHDAFVKAQHRLVMQSGAYQNATWAVAVAKGGVEEGQAMLADTIIVAPSGQIVAESSTQGDELVVAAIDLDATRSYKSTIFDFAAHREPGSYRLITQRKGAVPPS